MLHFADVGPASEVVENIPAVEEEEEEEEAAEAGPAVEVVAGESTLVAGEEVDVFVLVAQVEETGSAFAEAAPG